MKATFPRQTLMSGISLVENAVAGYGTLPILSNLLFEATPKGVDLVGTDLECFARVGLEARVEEAGRITAPAKTLAEIVRLLPDDNVAIVTSGSRLTLTCGRNVYHLATMSAEDFPDWPKVEASTRLTLRQADLKRLLDNTLFAMPSRDPRRVLMGTYFHLAENRLTCVATDGRKLGKSSAQPAKIEGPGEVSAIVPGRVLGEIKRALGEEGEVELAVTEKRIAFSLPNLSLTYLTALIDGKFPQYEAVIPASFKRTIDLPKAILDEAITRAAVLAERRHHSVILSFQPNELAIKAESFEEGSYEGVLEIQFGGEAFRIAFNYNYLHDVLKVAPDATVRMKVKEPAAPVVFECESDAETLYLVMPVRIADLEEESDEPEEGDDEEADEDDEA